MTDIVKYIPNGPANLKSWFPDIDWADVEAYNLELVNTNDEVIARIRNKIGDCCCGNAQNVRIHFVNWLGTIDAINFNHVEETLESKSDSWQKALDYPLTKSKGGHTRFNVHSNESYKATTISYDEDAMPWIKELFTTPKAWLQWKGQEDQADDYIPIIITDKKLITRKVQQRYVYEITIEYTMANENIHLR